MIRVLAKIKSTKFWYIIILVVIKPLFDLIWLNIINFKSRQIFLKYCHTNNLKKNKIFTKNDKFIVRGDENIKRYTEEIHKFLSKDFLKKMIEKIDENKKYTSDHYLFDKPKFQIDLYPYIDDPIKKIVLKIALNKKIIEMSSQYLGVMPVLGKITLNLNVPKHGSEERGSMFGIKMTLVIRLSIFLYQLMKYKLNGPLHYVKKFNKLGAFHKHTNIIKNQKKGKEIKSIFLNLNQKYQTKMLVFLQEIKEIFDDRQFSVYHRGGFVNKIIG